MNTNYSFLKGFSKSLVGAAVAGLSILAFVGMSAAPDVWDAPIADLVYEHLKSILGGMTVGGAVAFLINLAKNYR